MGKVIIRPAELKDAQAMLDIYGPYVRDTTVTAEYEVPSLEEFCRRISTFTAKTPWLLCEVDDRVVGYVYASPHRTRAAYQWSVETSIYVAQDFHRHGVASALFKALIDLLIMQGYYNIFVGITTPNEKSLAFHTSMGFVKSGAYQKSMYKFGKWRDVIWMGKSLCLHEPEPKPTRNFSEIRGSQPYWHIIKRAEDYVTDRL